MDSMVDGGREGVCITGKHGIGIGFGFAWSLWVLGVKASRRVLEGCWRWKASSPYHGGIRDPENMPEMQLVA